MADPSTWKKEVSFARTSEEQAPEADEPEKPFWKTEISFARRTKQDDGAEENAAPEAAAEEPVDEDGPGAEPAPVVELPVAEEPVDEAEDGTVPETGLDEPEGEPAPVLELPVAAAPPESEPENDPEGPVAEEPLWMRAVSFGAKAESEVPTDDLPGVAQPPIVELRVAPAPVESEPETGSEEPVDETGPSLDEPGPEPEAEPEGPPTETWSTLPWLPHEFAAPAESEPEPAPVQASKKRSVPLLVAGCAGIVMAALLGALFVLGNNRIASAKRHVDELNRQVAALAPPGAERQRLTGAQRAHVTAVTAALASRVSWDRVFRDVSLVLPKDVRLTSLTAGTAPAKFTMRGRTPWYQSLDRLVAGLRGEPDLRNVQLIGTTRSKVGGRQVLEFTIAAEVASPTEGGS